MFDGNYQYLLKLFSEDVIANRYAAWLSEMQATVNNIGGGEHFTISEENLWLAVLDYFTDIARLKPFHDIERTNVQKIYAYGIYWMLRRRPIQQASTTAHDLPRHLYYINEKTLLLILFPKMLKELNIDPEYANEKGKSEIMPFANLMYYNLRFRYVSQQSLELAIEAFFSGYKLGYKMWGIQ